MPGHCIYLLGFLFSLLATTVSAKVVPFVDMGFFFDYNKASEPVPIPITQQCETINIKWARGQATGPNPVAPYSLTVYTSTFIQPFVIPAGDGLSFDWAVPFAPGTQYMVCMYDANGVSGGCQDKYTVVTNLTTPAPTCQNITFVPQMSIKGTVADGGPLSLFGFNDQCTDVSIQPLNGTPPFTLTISPPLHPPFNLTSNTRDPISWTVSLSRSMPYFMSLVSADGFAWSAGPMHSGGNGPTDCLAPGTIPSKKANAIAAGAGVGGLFGGALILAVIFVIWQQVRKRRRSPPVGDYPFSPNMAGIQRGPSTVISTRTGTIAPTAASSSSGSSTVQSRSPTTELPYGTEAGRYSQTITIPQTSTSRTFRSESLYTPTAGGFRYVVQHHDAFPAAVYQSDGIVDLPPSYGGIRRPPQRQDSADDGSLTSPLEAAPPVPEKGAWS